MLNLDEIRFKISEWLSVNSNVIQLKKLLTKAAFILIISAYFLPVNTLLWLGVFIAIFHTYLNYKLK